MVEIGQCELHVPHKNWSGNPLEEQNYLEIERWSYRLADCLGACACWVAQYQNVINVDTAVTTHLDRSGFIARPSPCGTVDTSAITQVTVNIQWQSPPVFTAGNGCASWLISPAIGEGAANQNYGENVPAFTYTNPMSSFTRILPNGIWSGIPWTVYLLQNTGGTLAAVVNIHEYQPCCHCNWSTSGC